MHQQLTDHIFKISKGILKLTPKGVDEIIEIVKADGRIAHAMLFRHNSSNNTWEKVKKTYTTEEKINSAILAALDKKPVENFYKFECYNDAGELEGTIYTANSSLF